MIVNEGLITKLTQELTYLSGLTWRLFTNNFTITASTVKSDLTAAAWTGYADVTGITFGAASIVAGVALSTGTPNPSFGNSSGSSQNFYGWCCFDSGNKLVAAVNVGLTAIANGGAYVITPSTTLAEA